MRRTECVNKFQKKLNNYRKIKAGKTEQAKLHKAIETVINTIFVASMRENYEDETINGYDLNRYLCDKRYEVLARPAKVAVSATRNSRDLRDYAPENLDDICSPAEFMDAQAYIANFLKTDGLLDSNLREMTQLALVTDVIDRATTRDGALHYTEKPLLPVEVSFCPMKDYYYNYSEDELLDDLFTKLCQNLRQKKTSESRSDNKR